MYFYVAFTSVQGAHFQFPETDPCEIADIDATFHLTYQDDEGHTEVVFNSLFFFKAYGNFSPFIQSSGATLIDFFLLLFQDLSWFNWWVSFAPEFQCCYFCESSCLFYLSFKFDFCVSKIMHL